MKISTVREGVELKQPHSLKRPNVLNCAIPRLKMGQIKKTSRYILLRQEGTE
jgi:hypothetical protein